MPYSMLDYIKRQPEIMKKGFLNRNEYLDVFKTIFKSHDIKRVYFLGSGTSYHVSSLGSMWFNKYLNVEASASFPIVFVENENINKTKILKNDQILAIGVSQSGTSSSTIKAIEKAKEAGCITAAFTQDSTSQITKICDYTIVMPVEKEMVPPETQGYTGALLALYLGAITLANETGMISDYTDKINAVSLMVNESMQKAVEISENWIHTNRYILSKAHKISIIGSNLNYITALEGALKVGETMKRVAHGYESEEFAHLVDLSFEEEDYLFAIVHDNFAYERSLEICNLANQITKRVFVISNKVKSSKQDCYFDFKVEEDLSVFYYIIPFQMIGAIIAEYLGVDTSKFPYDDIKSIAHTSEYFLYKD